MLILRLFVVIKFVNPILQDFLQQFLIPEPRPFANPARPLTSQAFHQLSKYESFLCENNLKYFSDTTDMKRSKCVCNFPFHSEYSS